MLSEKNITEKLNLSLEKKEEHALRVLRIFYSHPKVNGKVYVSFSGGKDSTVLLHLVRRQFKETIGVFCDTGLEFPEIRQFVKNCENIRIIKPKNKFKNIIEKYGYPFPSKEQAFYIEQYKTTKSEKLQKIRIENKNFSISEKWKFLINSKFNVSSKCCDFLKKNPFKIFEKQTGLKPIIGTKIIDSELRRQKYGITGCNSFEGKIASRPLSIWTDKDIWDYIKKYNLNYSKIYDMGYERTGCVFCLFGISQEKNPNRLQILEKTHPKLYNYVMKELKYKEFCEEVNINYKFNQNLLF